MCSLVLADWLLLSVKMQSNEHLLNYKKMLLSIQK